VRGSPTLLIDRGGPVRRAGAVAGHVLPYIGSAVPANSAADLRSACPAAIGAGHFIQLDVPDQLNAMIERFMMITDLSAGW
jgi:hypothetical protein